MQEQATTYLSTLAHILMVFVAHQSSSHKDRNMKATTNAFVISAPI